MFRTDYELLQQSLAEPPAAAIRRNADLPDKESVRLFRQAVAESEPDKLVVDLGNRRGFGEVSAEERVAICGIAFQRRTATH